MWAFPDRKGRPCCLIPEATALFQERTKEFLNGRREAKFFYVARCYRYERPQAGRYREFTQLGFEHLSDDPAAASRMSRQLCQGFLDSLGLRYQLDSAARRGLSYYLNGEGFEMRVPELGAQKQVVGGAAAPTARAQASALAWTGWRLRLRRKASRFDVQRPGCCPAAS